VEREFMSDAGPDSLVLVYLRRIDERQERMERDFERRMGAIEVRLAAIETRIIAVEARMTAIEDWSRDTSGRLGHIERRLDLVDHQP
jgi:hypothetical protein